MNRLFTAFALGAVAAQAQTKPLPKNGGLTDERPTYSSPAEAQYKLVEPKLRTRWTEQPTENPWPEYPRPQLKRDNWLSLNGVWELQEAKANDTDAPFGKTLNQRVLVPYCLESGISGVALQLQNVWYRREFEVPSSFDGGVVLHFAAVDYRSTVYLNGKEIGSHTGGYDKFHFDVSDVVKKDGKNELVVFVNDPSDSEVVPVGKQRVEPSHIFYTPCSGIWQTVSIESVPKGEYVTAIQLRAAADGKVNATISTSTPDSSSSVTVKFLQPNGTDVIYTTQGKANQPFQFSVDFQPELWSPASPNLYNFTVEVGSDVAQSYTGFRTVERKEIDGVQRFVLNGKPIFQFGPLDQGYWPDGLHSPPSYEAMVFDIKYLKDLGMNFIRKHIKVEPDLYYYAADTLGIILMQDMPALPLVAPNEAEQKEFERQLDIMVNSHLSFPSILTFVIYNEGWGQLDSSPEIQIAPRLYDALAGHQLINAVTGWNDYAKLRLNISVGDYHDNHHYSSPQCGTPFYSRASIQYDRSRIGFQGEFGGVGVNTTIDHLWKDDVAIAAIDNTYEIDENLDAWNYRALRVIEELREQTERYDCNGGVYTQTTDVEGEVNGFLTYDRAVDHTDAEKWKAAIQALYDTFNAKVANGTEGAAIVNTNADGTGAAMRAVPTMVALLLSAILVAVTL
ncbi:glycoside hydrolase family 2 protein [Exidia glandulosa HHB12029]|uniref:Glycoside hydrolase family 2 protein n=1 Tax=Exidia glandulosa HHB12029 TaxID=1314781 RepID=A0A165DMI4_EXIGL|nr:glycoside hydrolase family 2 protein [Exidia glandulosa HHB12029]